MGPQAGDEAEGADLEYAAERLVGLAELVDLGDHRAARIGIQAADGRFVDRGEVRRGERLVARGAHRGDLEHVGEHLHPERPQERLRHRAAGDPRRRFTGTGALEDVPDVRRPNFWVPTRSA